MNPNQPKKAAWPRQVAVVVSDSPNVQMLLRELLRSYQWTVIDSTPSVERAVAMLRQSQAYLVIADDTPGRPAIAQLRYLMSDPLAVCTPVLSFCLESNRNELPAFARMGRPVVVDKPLTPSKFLPGFLNLVRAWEREPLASLRQAAYQFQNGNDAQGIRGLVKAKDIDSVRNFAVHALALHLRRLGRVKEAEALLLSALKKAPRELGLILALGDLYMQSAMPKLAHRLLNGARANFGNSCAIVPDLIQANLLMGRIDEAIADLFTLQRSDFQIEETNSFLARLLFAEGREAEAERILNNNRNALKRLQNGWSNAENMPGLINNLAG